MDEPQLIRTLFSNKPRKYSVLVSLGFVLLCGVLSQMFWEGQLPNWWANPVQFFSEGMYWQIFTATMIHGDWGHYLSNSYMLFILGIFVYGYFGFFTYPIVAVVLAAATNLLTIGSYPDQVRLLGASGLVYVLAGFWLTMFWLVQRQHEWHRRLLRVLGVALAILFPTTFEPTTSYRAHAIGFAVGLIYAVLHFILNKNEIRSHEVWREPRPEVSVSDSQAYDL